MWGEFTGPGHERSAIDESRPAKPSVPSAANERRRAQTPILGLVLLIGVVAAGAVAIVLLGGAGLDAQKTAAEIDHAEGTLVEFAHAADTATTTSDEGVPVSVGAFDRGTVETDGDAGQVRISQTTDSGTEELYNESLGTLHYVAGDTEIAYQGGGVWRSQGDGSTLISAPALEYRDGTLTFSIARLEQTHTQGNAVDGSLHQSGSPTSIELHNDESTPRGAASDVQIEVESAYCDGWERELEAAVPGSVVESCAAEQSDRVKLELTVPPRIDGVDSAVVAQEIDIDNSANQTLIEGDVRTDAVDGDRVNGTVSDTGYDVPSVDGAVTGMVGQCENEWTADLPDEIDDPGRHCVDAIDDTLTVDTSSGDVEIVVRDSIGDPNFQDDLHVDGENELTIYLDGDLSVRGTAAIGNDSDPSQTQLLVSDAGSITTEAGGTPQLSALLYAPDSTVTLQGDPALDGSVIADRVEIPNTNPGVVEYDDRIAGVEIVPGPGPFLHYLDVTAYELTIDD